MIKKPLYLLLVNDHTVNTLVGKYEFTSGAWTPSIFTSSVVPENCSYPAILIDQVAGTIFGCRQNRGAEIQVDIRIYDDKDRSDKVINELAHNVWRAVDRANLHVLLAAENYEDWGCQADPPQQIEDPDRYPGYLVRVKARVLEM